MWEDLIEIVENKLLCTLQYVMHVVGNVKYHLDHQEINQYTVVAALNNRVVVEIETEEIGEIQEIQEMIEILETPEIEVVKVCTLQYVMIVVISV